MSAPVPSTSFANTTARLPEAACAPRESTTSRFALRQYVAQGVGRCQWLSGLVLGLALVLTGCGDLQLPSQDSTVAADTDALFKFIFWLCAICLLVIVGTLLCFLIKYRRRPGVEPRPGPTGNVPLLIAWSLPPCVLVVVLFCWGFTGHVNLSTPPADAIKIKVVAKQFDFTFVYPNGGSEKKDEANPRPALHVPVDHPVVVELVSADVQHSFFIPRFRVKQAIVPGRTTECWFEATQIGDDSRLFCSEFCGTDYSLMVHKVIVQSREDYDAYVAGLLVTEGPRSPETLYRSFCLACHPKTAKPGPLAPGFVGLYGSKRKVYDSATKKVVEIIADDDYLRESIVDPSAKVSREPSLTGADFLDNVMVKTYGSDFTEEEIEGLIRWLEELK